MIPDYGLHGGGWHLMHHKGKLNPHLDYFIHPKANLQRKYNLIVFLSKGNLYIFSGKKIGVVKFVFIIRIKKT